MIAFNDQQLIRAKNKFHWTWNQSSCLIIWHERQIFSLTGNCYGQGELAGRLQIHFFSSIYAYKWKLNFTVIHLLLKCTFMPLCINWPELLWGVTSLDTYLKWQKSPDPRDCFWFCRSLSLCFWWAMSWMPFLTIIALGWAALPVVVSHVCVSLYELVCYDRALKDRELSQTN